MAIPNRQIGWSNKANLLWQISKQLERLTQVAGNVIIPSVAGSFQWTIFNEYAPAVFPGVISLPNHMDGEGYTDINLLGSGGYELYINPIDSVGNDQTSFLGQLVGHSGILVLAQGGNSIVLSFTPDSFFTGGYDDNIYYDDVFGPSVQGSLQILVYASAPFNLTDPITILVNIND